MNFQYLSQGPEKKISNTMCSQLDVVGMELNRNRMVIEDSTNIAEYFPSPGRPFKIQIFEYSCRNQPNFIILFTDFQKLLYLTLTIKYHSFTPFMCLLPSREGLEIADLGQYSTQSISDPSHFNFDQFRKFLDMKFSKL